MTRGLKRSRPTNNLSLMVKNIEDDKTTFGKYYAQCDVSKAPKKTRSFLLTNDDDIETRETTAHTTPPQLHRNEPLVFSDAWSKFFSPRCTTLEEGDFLIDCNTRMSNHAVNLRSGNPIESFRSVQVSEENMYACWDFDSKFVETSPVDSVSILKFPPSTYQNDFSFSRQTKRRKHSIHLNEEIAVVTPDIKPIEILTLSVPFFELGI
uniref:Uncharacterized protein n=1 Tax=Corethron hystrix TaxID=216773 RepID=A0A7S1BY26_9STRA|mmetsp:Transcript_4829/g.9564  ORF Transcript_4829/g.9564 Transcript_4829/m.9564 type:complete len:208 (+) Transcript_4829:116-739(+)